MKFCQLLFLAFSTVIVSSAPTEDEIKSLPGVNYGIYFKQYSGYLNGTNGKFLHYWFTESQKNPAEDPVILWMTGGPGCSSIFALLEELGPISITNDGLTLYRNKYSWNTFANILFLETPVCTGFSYAKDGNCSNSDDQTAIQNYNALRDFYLKFPEYVNNKLFIMGESYASIYVQTLSLLVVNELPNPSMNFEGYAIGNGMLDYRALSNAMMFVGYFHSFLSTNLWRNMVSDCCGDVADPRKCNFYDNMTESCETSVLKGKLLLLYGGLNIWNLNKKCFRSDNNDIEPFVTVADVEDKSLKELKEKYQKYSDDKSISPQCEGEYTSNISLWINQPSVREALHIPKSVQDWEYCSTEVRKMYSKQPNSTTNHLLDLIGKDVRGLIYYGDDDLVVGPLGNMWLLEGLGLEEVEPWQMWFLSDGTGGGFYKKYHNLDFVTLRGAGHMAPGDKPLAALQMIKEFVEENSYSPSPPTEPSVASFTMYISGTYGFCLALFSIILAALVNSIG